MSEHQAKRSGSAQAAAIEPRSSRVVELGRERARVAWDWVDKALQALRSDRDRARYGTLARKLPSLLHTSGLGQTLAYLFAKAAGNANKPEGLLLEQLTTHLRRRLGRPPAASQSLHPCMQLVLDLEPAEYRRATAEAFAAAEWLKRFAEGQIEDEDNP